MRRLLLGVAGLWAAGLLAAEAHAEEVWQTLPQPPAMPAPAESGMAPVNDIEMYYAVYGEGELTVGMRTLLPFVAMFHCNRFGLDGDRQAMLARAMVDAWDPKRALVADGKASGR